MKLREHTEVGFLMLQWLGVLVPGAFRQEVLRGRRTGKSADLRLLADECEPLPTPVQRLIALYPTRKKLMLRARQSLTCPSCGGPITQAQLDDPHGCCEDCYWKLPDGSVGDRQDRPEVYAALERPPPEALWWLSFADDTRCAGLAIVSVTGDQTLQHATSTARRLGLVPEGAWQVAGVPVPERFRAQCAPHAGKLLTVDQVDALAELEARSIKSLEAENSGAGSVEIECMQLEREADDAYRRIGGAADRAAFKRIPGATLTVCPEWAGAMGYDPDKLEDA